MAATSPHRTSPRKRKRRSRRSRDHLIEIRQRENGTLAQLRADAEALRMHLSSGQIIKEAVLVNHKRVSRRTRRDYEKDALHFAEYIESVRRRNLYTARRTDVVMFLNHLEEKGGASPDESRRECSWCRERGYPDGPGGCGWGPSTIKGYLAAVRYVYHHFAWESDLPDHDPTAQIPSPKVVTESQWSPSRGQVEELLAAPGRPRDRLLAHWIFFAPSRREPFVNALWSHIDLESGTWDLVSRVISSSLVCDIIGRCRVVLLPSLSS